MTDLIAFIAALLLKYLTLPYQDHADYREDWRPT